VNSFQVAGDTLVFLRDGALYRRVGLSSSSVVVWPSPGSSGSVASFSHSNGYLAVQTTTSAVYTRAPGGAWSFKTSGNVQYRLAGERLVINFADYHVLYSLYMVSAPTSWSYEYQGSNILDFQVRPENQRLVVIDAGTLYGKDGGGSWYGLHGSGDGYATKAFLSGTHIAVYVDRGYGYSELRVKEGLHGIWDGYMGAIYSPQHVDLCGDKVSLMNWGNDLYIKDYSTGDMFYQGYVYGGYYTSAARLSGANCDYVTKLDHWNVLYAKYGLDDNTEYIGFQTNAAALRQRPALD
jgi:hypothetical protein